MPPEIIKLIANFEGEHEKFRRCVESCMFSIMNKAHDMGVDPNKRRRKHMAQGMRLAVRLMSFELGMQWAGARRFF